MGLTIPSSELSDALLESDFLSTTEFDNAVKAVVEDEIERRVDREIDRADIPSLIEEKMPCYGDEINELKERCESLENEINDLREQRDIHYKNYSNFINEVANFEERTLRRLIKQEELTDEIKRQHNALVDQIDRSWILSWLLG